jgi:predicted HAD superfamily Cof-like phosphohydrolase
MPAESPQDRSLIGRIAAHESWANTPDRPARTAPARAALAAKFLDEADGDPLRAASLRKAYYARLALASAKARRKAAAAAEQVQADAELAATVEAGTPGDAA